MPACASEVDPRQEALAAPAILCLRRPLVAGALFAACTCCVLIYLFTPDDPSPQVAADRHQATVTPARLLLPARAEAALRDGLPSFIPKEGRDARYGTDHPGWERYLSSSREYLVFREQGTIRALQVVALSSQALDEDSISSALRECCGDTTWTVTSRSSRGGYIVEVGLSPSHAEVVCYRKGRGGDIRGVVLSYQ